MRLSKFSAKLVRSFLIFIISEFNWLLLMGHTSDDFEDIRPLNCWYKIHVELAHEVISEMGLKPCFLTILQAFSDIFWVIFLQPQRLNVNMPEPIIYVRIVFGPSLAFFQELFLVHHLFWLLMKFFHWWWHILILLNLPSVEPFFSGRSEQ